MVSRLAGTLQSLSYNGELLKLPEQLFILSQWFLVPPYYCATPR